MSSDESLSLDVSLPTPDTLEGVKALITNYKKKHEQLLQEQKELAACRDDRQELTREFKRRTEKLSQTLEEDKRAYKQKIEHEKAQLDLILQDEAKLMEEIEAVKAALMEEEAQNKHLKQQTDVFGAVPERDVFFNGLTGKPSDTPTFEMEPQIYYPMDGGTALVTFEEDVVAKKILDTKQHRVELGGECSITVEARPVQLMVPSLVEIDSEVCPHRILISNLPRMDEETLLNKLEIHFSKSRNGGGEVDSCEMMADSWTVVLAFVEKGVAKGLTDTEYHEVKLQQMHRVRVTPFLNGNITNLKTKMSLCPRTVLLTGIPDIMERETLQDLLEIHFQKSINGGGEIEAFLYNPLGQHTSALFDGISRKEEEQ
ncbi:interferon-induced 35 kDa protein [Chaetodon trifascialis]|uniref:interferon-induced 35 kDa protein n=1 Tax=Chaetodon trifascialis TaxID=109706 RepID=UPI0039967AB4